MTKVHERLLKNYFMSIKENARGFITNADAPPRFPSKKALDAHLWWICDQRTIFICWLHLGQPQLLSQRHGPPKTVVWGLSYFHPTWDSKCTLLRAPKWASRGFARSTWLIDNMPLGPIIPVSPFFLSKVLTLQ